MLNRNHSANASRKLAAALGLAVASTLILAALIGATRVVATNANTPKQQVARAWEQAADVGRYEFHTTIVQTLHPTLRLYNVGRSARTERYTIQGEMDQPAERMLLQMQLPNQPPVDLKIEDGRSFGRLDALGQWTELEANTDIFAPGGDPLGFLVTAENVAVVGNGPGRAASPDEFFPSELLPSEMAASVTRYQFDMNGLQFAKYMRAQTETYLRERGELPAGVTLQDAQAYVDMQGQGELWVSEAGLPVRQILRLEFPPEDGARDWVEAEITTSYSNWDQRSVELLSFDWRRPAASLGNWLAAHVSPKALERGAINLSMCLVVAGLVSWMVARSRSPKLRVALNLAIIAATLAVPLLQAQQVSAFYEAHNERQQQAQADQESQENEQTLIAEILGRDFDPYENPLDSEPLSATSEPLPPGKDKTRLARKPLSVDSASNAPLATLSSTCIITETSDCDGDGLTDNIEIYELGTWIDDVDTDDDTISDWVEVTGFDVGGRTWYLDPRKADSNGDGLTDGMECVNRTNVFSETVTTGLELIPCEDEDEDGVPDAYDFDNDGDGVPDGVDANPNGFQEVANQQFGLTLSGAETGKSIYFDLQIRPTDDRHLWWTNNVLDWPDNDSSGQITKISTATLTTDGDMLLTPLLEITIPYNAANPTRGLPKLSAVSINNITATTPITTWVDTTTLDKYAISLSQDASGTLFAYVPLTVILDNVGGGAVAWGARMLYTLDPGAGGWGAAHQMRLLWTVTAMLDQCNPPTGTSDPVTYCENTSNWTPTTTIIQTYPDDFIVTGFTVQENHGAQAMLVAQKPGAGGSSHYDSQLWHLADTLQDVFLNSQTITQTVSRRFTLSDIPAQAPNWGIPAGDLAVQSFNNLADDTALVEALDGDAVPAFLRTVHTAPTVPLTTTVLLLSEEIQRSRTMNEIISIGELVTVTGQVTLSNFTRAVTFTNNTFTVDFTGAVSNTYGTMRAQPYTHNGVGWSDEEIGPFLDQLETDLTPVFTTAVLTGTLGVAPEDVARARAGAIRLAQHYYLGLFNTSSGRLAAGDGSLIGEPMIAADYARPTEPAATIAGRLAAQVQSYYGRLNLEGFDIPTVDTAVDHESAAAWASLAASRGAVLSAFGDLVQGNSATSVALALRELDSLPDTITNEKLLDMSALVYTRHSAASHIRGFFGGDDSMLGFLASNAYATARLANSIRNMVFAVIRAKKLKVVFDATSCARWIINDIWKNRSKPNYVGWQSSLKQADLSLTQQSAPMRPLLKSTIKWAKIGIAQQVLMSGFAIASAVFSGVETDSPAFSRLLAEQIAAIILTIVKNLLRIAFVAATLGLGVIVLAVIELIDAVMVIACAALGLDNPESGVNTGDPEAWGKWFCGGITGALVQVLAYVINDTTPLVDFEKSERLNMVWSAPQITNLTGTEGAVVGNQITLSATITNTLYMDSPNWMGYIYAWQWADEYLDDATFVYAVQSAETDISPDLNGTTWEAVPGRPAERAGVDEGARFRQEFTTAGTHIFTQPGLDQGLPRYFSEGFATQMQNCWLVPFHLPPFVIPVCWLSEFDHTNHTSLSATFIFDVLPTDLDDFHRLTQTDVTATGETSYRLGWDDQFPTLADADGDGLRSVKLGGNDPNDSTPDADGDGLPDYYEVANAGFNPQKADSDCDGLTDYWEAFYGTKPNLADSDSDGLFDSQEVFHPTRTYPYENSAWSNANPTTCATGLGQTAAYEGGWEIVYDFDGATPLAFRVTSDPLDPDSDDDGLSDKQEQVYGYHPGVASSLNVMSLASQIETSSGHYPYVKTTDTITYTANITNELSARYARGLLEVELPLDNVLRTHSLGIVPPLGTVTMTGAVGVSESGLNSSQTTEMGLRAGAIIDDATGRVLWLHMNEPAGSATFADASFHGNDAACTGDECPTANRNELTFDGVDDYLAIPDNSDLDLTQFTIALYVKPTATMPTLQSLINKETDTGGSQNFRLYINHNTNTVHYSMQKSNCSDYASANSSGSLVVGQWNHVAMTYDGAQTAVYINGQPQGTVAYAGTPCQNTRPIKIGVTSIGYFPFDGSIDEVEIYPQALTAATIQQRYGAPVLHLDLRDSNTWSGTGVSCPAGRCPTVWSDGTAFNQKQHLQANADLSGDAFTFVTWMKPIARTYPFNSGTAAHYAALTDHHDKWTDADYQGVFGYKDPTDNENIFPSLFVGDNGKLRMVWGDGEDTCEVSTAATGLIQQDIWQQVAVTYNGTTLTYYVNGQEISGGTIIEGDCANITPPVVPQFYIGRPNETGYVRFDNVRFTSETDHTGCMEVRLNWGTDGSGGNIYQKNSYCNTSSAESINQYRTITTDSASQSFRLWEQDRKGNTSYEGSGSWWENFWNSNWDDNLLHVTGITNISHLGTSSPHFSELGETGHQTMNGNLYWGMSNDFFQGELDDFRVYQYALGAEAVADLFESSSTALELHLDEAPGETVFADISGSHVTVSCSGATCPTSGVSGRHNQALEFDGVDDLLTLSARSDELGLSKSSFTVMAWVKGDNYGNPSTQRILSFGGRSLMMYYSAPKAYFGRSGRRSYQAVVQNSNISADEWTHVAYVYELVDGVVGAVSIYVNGQQMVVTGDPFASDPLIYYVPPYVGSDNVVLGSNFNGRIDDLTIVRRAMTTAEIQAAVGQAPLVNLHLDEDQYSGAFVDDTQFANHATCMGNCPEAGDKGQIREAAVFNNSLLTVSNSSSMTFTDFTVGLWVKPTDVITKSQPLITKEADDGNNRNFGLFIKPGSMKVYYSLQPGTCSGWVSADSAGSLLEDQWNHVMMTYDGAQAAVYINGALQGTNAYAGTPCQNTHPIKIGSENSAYTPFSGGLDEAVVYDRALESMEVADLYNYQAAWYDVIDHHKVIIDADGPTIDLNYIPPVISDQETIMFIGAEDATTAVTRVEYQIDSGQWIQIVITDTNTDPWVFAFPASTPGAHTLKVRATDTVGNQTTVGPITILVDSDAPNLHFMPPSGGDGILTRAAGGRGATAETTTVHQVTAELTLNGTISDTLSDITPHTVQVTVRDHAGTPVSGPQQGVLSADHSWQAVQTFPTPPYGVYTVTAVGEDDIGNLATASSVIQLDGLGPYADVVTDVVTINPLVPTTFAGIASDAPYPAGSRRLHLHFEAGPGVFVDGSKNQFSLTCTLCPTTGVSGIHGDAVSFDGADYLEIENNSLITATAADQLGLDNTSFTVLAWVSATVWSGENAILGASPITSSEGLYVGIQNGSPFLGYGGDDSVMTGTIPTDEWVHLAWRYDTATGERAFFINGAQTVTATVGHAAYTATETIQVGRARGGDGYTGDLDELVVYAQALPDETIYDIANPLDVGIADMQVRFRQFAGSAGQPEYITQYGGVWNPATLASNTSNFTTWQATMPTDLELGGYKLDLLVTDGVSNTTFVEGAWSGVMIAPDLTISKTVAVTATAASENITYTLAYTNVGDVGATGVVLTETVPTDTSFNTGASAASWSCTPAAGTPGSNCTYPVGYLAAGASDAISFTLTVTDTLTPGTVAVVNSAEIDADSGHIETTEPYLDCITPIYGCIWVVIPHYYDSDETDNTASTRTPMDGAPDLQVTKDDGGITATVMSDDVFTYTITYTNTGSQAADARLIETLPPFVQSTYENHLAGWDCPSIYAGDCTYDLGTLAPDASGSVPFVAVMWTQMPDVPVLTNTVAITDISGGGDLNLLDNTATITTPWTFNFGAAPDNNVVTVTEGGIVTNTGTVLLPSPSDGWWLESNSGTLDFDPYSNITWTWTYTSTDGLDQTQTISITASDDAYNAITTTFQLVVENVAPTITLTGAVTATVDSSYTLTLGSVVDPGADTVITDTGCTVHWGDVISDTCYSAIGGGSLTHVYTTSLVTRTITVDLTDEDGVHTAAGTIDVFVAPVAPAVRVVSDTLTADEGDVAANSGVYGPTDGSVDLNASEGVVTATAAGDWTWSFDTSTGAEGARSVVITASNISTDATVAFTLTVNGDGVGGPVEDSAPNSGDGNDDGIPDRQQGHVASLPVSGGDYATLAVSGALALRNVTHSDTPPASPPAGMVFPLGFLDYQIEDVSVGSAVTVTLWLPDISAINSYYQYGPTPDNETGHWYEFLYDGATGAQILSDRIVLHFVDGQRGDHDLTANEVIVDPGAPVYALPRHTLEAEVSGLGDVTPLGSSSYISGTVVPVTATAGVGWSFGGWLEDLSGSDPTQSLTIDGDKLVIATFTLDRYTLETNVAGLGSLTVDPVQDEYRHGDAVNVTATLATGWVFAGWSGDFGGASASESLTMTGNTVITATFTPISYTVDANVTGSGSVALDPDHASYIYDDLVMVQAIPDAGWKLDGWTGDFSGADLISSLLIDGDKTITAAFSPATYTVDLAVVGIGQITITPQKSGYDYGDEITLTATADLGWSFDSWLVGPVSNTVVQTMTMNSDKFVLALFTEDAYTLTVTWEGYGEISLAPFKPDYTYGEVVTATATAAQGYQFDSWGGDCAGTGACVVTMDAAKIVTATFALHSADLFILKTVAPTTHVNPGGIITYTLAFSNVGNVTATGVVITDELPVHVTVQSVVSSGVVITPVGSAPHVWQVQDLDEGQGGVITITALLDKPLAAGTFTNTAEIAATSFEVYTGDNSSSAQVTVPPADLVILKIAAATSVNLGEAVTYTLTFSNVGQGLATGVVIADAVPVSVTNPSAVSAGDVAITPRGGAPYTWDVADLAQGQGGIITITGWLSDSLPGGHTFTNTAEIATTSTDSDASNDSSDATITVSDADLEIIKEASRLTPDPDETIVYTITVTNHGPQDGTNIVVSDTLPGDVTYESDDGDYVGGVWTVGDLNVNASATLHITATVDASNGAFITNTAVISAADQGDSDPDNNRADRLIVVGGADLALVKTVNDSTPNEEDAITYAITVTNHGSNAVTGVVVSDTLPLSVTLVSSSTTQGDYVNGVWDVGDLDDGDSKTLHITVTVDAGTAFTTIANTAVISETNRGDPESSNDADVAIIAVQDAGAVVVTVTPGGGGTLTYVDSQGLTITVDIPPGAVTDPVNLVYLPLPASIHPAPPGMRFVGSVFTLDVYDGWMLSPGYVFDPPIIITIHYSDDDVAGIDEETLVLEYWNGTAWEDAACEPYDRHPDENWLAVPVCHLSEFALFGTETLLFAPVGGYTEPLRLLALFWLLRLLAVAVVAGASAAVALVKRRRERRLSR